MKCRDCPNLCIHPYESDKNELILTCANLWHLGDMSEGNDELYYLGHISSIQDILTLPEMNIECKKQIEKYIEEKCKRRTDISVAWDKLDNNKKEHFYEINIEEAKDE